MESPPKFALSEMLTVECGAGTLYNLQSGRVVMMKIT